MVCLNTASIDQITFFYWKKLTIVFLQGTTHLTVEQKC